MDNEKNGKATSDEDIESQDENLDGASGGQADNQGQGEKANEPKDRTFTQEQVTRMMSREKKQGRSAAFNELGVDPGDSKMVQQVKAFIEAQKTSEQKAAEKSVEDAKKESEAVQRAQVAETKLMAIELGVQPKFVDDAIAIVTYKAGSEGFEDEDALKNALSEVKAKHPDWFEVSSQDDKSGKKSVGQKGTGSSIKGTSEDKPSKGSGMGARLAASRKQSQSKQSYWGKH